MYRVMLQSAEPHWPGLKLFLMGVGSVAQDIGSLYPFFLAVEKRETLEDFRRNIRIFGH